MDDWHIYVLRCADGSLYTGVTIDLERRLVEHNQIDRLAAKYTRPRRPVTLVYSEVLPTRAAAYRRESVIKNMPKSIKEKLIIADNQI